MGTPEASLITLELAGREGARLRWAPVQESDETPRSPWLLESEPDWGLLDSIRLPSTTGPRSGWRRSARELRAAMVTTS
jgi:hypothetical protein